MRLPFAKRLLVLILISLSSCQKPLMANEQRADCGNVNAIKCSVLQRAMSPSKNYEITTSIDSFGGGLGTGYDSADVYIRRVGDSGSNTLLFSVEDNADDLSNKNFRVAWRPSDQILIEYGHGDVTFQVVKFAGKPVATVHDANLDQIARQ